MVSLNGMPVENRGNAMKKLLITIIFLSSIMLSTASRAEFNVSVGIAMPPVVVFAGTPGLVVIPGTYVYAIPDVAPEIFFHVGWWWRLWDGRWYRSHHYDRGWAYFRGVPRFYYDVDPGWRDYYRHRNWYGHRWDYERIPAHHVQQNWSKWQNNRYWDKQKNWGVRNYQPRPYQQGSEMRPQKQDQDRQRQDYQRSQPRMEQQPRYQEQRSKGQYEKKGAQDQRPQYYQQQGRDYQRPKDSSPKRSHEVQQPRGEKQYQERNAQPNQQRPQGKSQNKNYQ